MKKIMVANGIEITDISLGAGARGRSTEAYETSFRIMDRYLELGGNCFDTARIYEQGRSDEVLGQYLKSRKNRDAVIICTKGSHPTDPNAMFISRLSKEEITEDLEDSLRVLGTDHTDMHLLHRDNPKLPVEPIVEALSELVTSGKARAVGLSNWSVARINEAMQYANQSGLVAPSISQLHHSLLLTTSPATGDFTQIPMSDVEFGWYKEMSMPVMGFGAQGRGYIAKYVAGDALSARSIRYYGHLPENDRRAQRLIALAAQMGASPAAVATAYVRDSGLVASPLCAFSSVAQLEDSLGADAFRLAADQIAYLEGKRDLA